MTVDAAVLARLDRDALGDGASIDPDRVGDLRSGEYWLVTDDRLRLAIKVALITGRPLLLLGPSGSGKSSLARAISETLGWTYFETVVTSQTRLDDLVGSVDLVRRLHQAELAGRVPGEVFPTDPGAFVEPGVLWWAFDPQSAAQAGSAPAGGRTSPGRPARNPTSNDRAVVLIDEIDKAEPDVPNNLLVPLGSFELQVPGRDDVVTVAPERRPLVCITSNEEREMPPAFLRRCVAVRLGVLGPSELAEIASRHVPGASQELIETALRRLGLHVTNTSVSTAEFIDVVRAAVGLHVPADGSSPIWAGLEELLRSPARPGRR
ncbi:MAG: AAA family ATPase [Acidimicrobiia bacterium]